MKAVRFQRYGGVEVLEVVEVPEPVAERGQVVVRVRSAAINPGETAIREGRVHRKWPATFPSGQGSDFAGVVTTVSADVDSFQAGDEVFGYSNTRSSHAELVSVPAVQVFRMPRNLPWDVAGALFVAPVAGLAGTIAVQPRRGETVVVSGAAGGSGFVAAQLARNSGATVLGLASRPNHKWLVENGILPIDYGVGLAQRVRDRAPRGVQALIDCHLGPYLDLGIELQVPPCRMNTIVNFGDASRLGVSTLGSSQTVTRTRLAHLADLAATGSLKVPIAATFPLSEVQDAYRLLEGGHVRGKVVLKP